jgi:hypothetical protein
VTSANDAADAEQQRLRAVAATEQARREVDQSKHLLETFAQQLTELDGKVTVAQRAVAVKITAVDRRRAEQEADEENRSRARARHHQQEVRQAEEDRIRKNGLRVDCVNEVLGCRNR